MQPDTRRRNILIASIVLGIIIVGALIYLVFINLNKNTYGEGISINNYDQKVKNLSKQYKDSISAALYSTIKLNTPGDIKASDVKDATIREGSDNQKVIQNQKQYSGSFIVDIASLKQSYKVQYTYSINPNDPLLSGYPILISCLAAEDLIYGDFNCKDMSGNDNKKDDIIVGYLPYQTYDFVLRADTTSGKLVLYANLQISSMDLSGDLASRQQTVALYKKEVTDWIKSKNLDPAKYTIHYNYDNDGNPITPPQSSGD